MSLRACPYCGTQIPVKAVCACHGDYLSRYTTVTVVLQPVAIEKLMQITKDGKLRPWFAQAIERRQDSVTAYGIVRVVVHDSKDTDSKDTETENI